MIKQLLVPCATALVLLPSGSPAQAPCAPVVYYHPCMPVVYYPSVVVAQPVYLNSVVVADCPPAVATVGPTQPTIVPERMAAPNKPDEKKPEEKKSVKVDPPLEFSKPREAEASPIIKPAGNKEKEPAKEPVKEDKIPALDLPTKPAPKPVEKQPEPKKMELPAFELPILPDAPAPAPKTPDTLPKIDSTALPIPNVVKPQDTPKLEVPPAKGDLNLPSFDIPLPMGEPAKQVEANKTSVSKASPLAAERESRFDLFPVDGAAPASPMAKRMIGFINKSAKDVLLTVDGQSVVLPAKSLIRAELPAKFTWQLGTDDERKETVGSTSPGLDIVIRK